MDGLAGFLTEIFIKRFLGNNEARYRRFKVGVLAKSTYYAFVNTVVYDLMGSLRFVLFYFKMKLNFFIFHTCVSDLIQWDPSMFKKLVREKMFEKFNQPRRK